MAYISKKASARATFAGYGIMGKTILAAFDDFNEGQKVLIEEYARFNSEAVIQRDVDFNFFFGWELNQEVLRYYCDIRVPHDEAFGDLLDKAQENARYFIDQAFNGTFYGDDPSSIFEEAKENEKEAYDDISRRISVYI